MTQRPLVWDLWLDCYQPSKQSSGTWVHGSSLDELVDIDLAGYAGGVLCTSAQVVREAAGRSRGDPS